MTDRETLVVGDFTAEEVATIIGRFCNRNGSGGLTTLVECLMREHPTLQQRFTLLMDKWFEKQAENSHFDQRTKATVMLARSYLAHIPASDRHLPCL